MAVDNFYAAMPLLVERLRMELPYQQPDGIRTIDATDLLAGVRDTTKYCPAVFVMPSPMDAIDSSEQGGVVVDQQDYQITVCVANVHDKAKVAAIDIAAGSIMLTVFNALAGWDGLPDGFRAPQYRGRGAPYYAVGYAEYPMFFSITAVIGA